MKENNKKMVEYQHEIDHALINEAIKEFRQDKKDTKADIKEIKEALLGENGLITQQELLKQGFTRLWWFVGTIVIAFVGLTIKAII